MQRPLVLSLLATAVATALACLWGAPAYADVRKECVEAADRGQTLRDQGKPLEARESFVTCARSACPTVVANRCTAWASEVSQEIATLTVHAVDGAGKDIVDVEVIVDNVPRTKALDGLPIPIDPGVHEIVFRHAGDQDVQQKVLIESGEKLRPMSVRFGSNLAPSAPATPSAPPAEVPAVPAEESPKARFRFPVVSAVTLGVGAASFIAMGVLIGTTASDVNHDRATCAGHCDPSDVSSANTRITLANVAMGVGIAGVAASAVTLVVLNLDHHERAAQAGGREVRFRLGRGGLEALGTF